MPLFPWTRLAGTPLWNAARATYGADPRRRYHVWAHVGRLYHWAQVWSLPYDLALDRAILAHDVIYDERPDKEIRSAQWLQAMTGEACETEVALIHATIAHPITPGGDNRIQLLDLADLGVPSFVAPNRVLIRAEIVALHDITALDFARGNLTFFSAMRERYPQSLLAQLDATEAAHLAPILAGIDTCLALAQAELAAG